MEWIDSHTHLEYEYPISIDEYLKNAIDQGVKKFITIGTELKSFEQLKNFAEEHEAIYFTVGLHPHEAKDWNQETEDKMTELQSHPKCVAVGEVGLDYHYDHSPRETQRKVLDRQLELALKWNLPVVIHAREAEEHLLEHLTAYAKKCKLPQGPGVIHCFSGSSNFATECLKLGFYISFSGILTFKKANDLREIASKVPHDKILLETDSPYLAPMPYRGKPNQSAYLVETAKKLAETLNMPLEELSKITVANTKKLFKI